MITVNVRGMAGLEHSLEQIAQRLPYAMMRALNNTAFAIRDAERQELTRSFDRPTPWLLKTIYVTKARAQRLTAAVGPTDWFSRGGYGNAMTTPWERVLAPHVYGGQRGFKAVERRLQAAGLLPRGWYVVPGQGAMLDGYGNMRGGDLVQIMSWIGAMRLYAGDNTNRLNRQTQRRNRMERKRQRYFTVTVDSYRTGLTPGVYQVFSDKSIKPVLIFVSRARYRKRVRWFEVANAVAQAMFADELRRQVASERVR